jgi:hypothetical protein
MKIEMCCFFKPERRFIPVEADLLPEIAPHLADVATWAVHRGVETDRLWWMVSNVETGFFATYDADRAQAIRRARDLLAEKTQEEILMRYRKVQKYMKKQPTR